MQLPLRFTLFMMFDNMFKIMYAISWNGFKFLNLMRQRNIFCWPLLIITDVKKRKICNAEIR